MLNGTTTYYRGNDAEYDGTNWSYYYYFGDQQVAVREGSNLTYLYQDHLGSTTVAIDATTSRAQYLPYGGRLDSVDLGTSYTYTGQQVLDGLDILNYGARWYDPLTGRFLQPDTIVPEPFNPQSLNRYAYCLNNPIKYTDPTGRAYDQGGVGSIKALVPRNLYLDRSLDELLIDFRAADNGNFMGTISGFDASAGFWSNPSYETAAAALEFVTGLRAQGLEKATEYYTNASITDRKAIVGALVTYYAYETSKAPGSQYFTLQFGTVRNYETLGSSTDPVWGSFTGDASSSSISGPLILLDARLLGSLGSPNDLPDNVMMEIIMTAAHESLHFSDYLSRGRYQDAKSNDETRARAYEAACYDTFFF